MKRRVQIYNTRDSPKIQITQYWTSDKLSSQVTKSDENHTTIYFGRVDFVGDYFRRTGVTDKDFFRRGWLCLRGKGGFNQKNYLCTWPMFQNSLTRETAGYISFKKTFPTIHRECELWWQPNQKYLASSGFSRPDATLRSVASGRVNQKWQIEWKSKWKLVKNFSANFIDFLLSELNSQTL